MRFLIWLFKKWYRADKFITLLLSAIVLLILTTFLSWFFFGINAGFIILRIWFFAYLLLVVGWLLYLAGNAIWAQYRAYKDETGASELKLFQKLKGINPNATSWHGPV